MPRKNKLKLLNQEPVTTTIETLSHDGRGITHINGKTVFVVGGLPGETLQFEYLRQRGSFDEARAIDIIAPGPGRVEPKCAHFGVCGGCSLQHIDLSLQLHHKQQAFQELLRKQGRIEPKQWLEPITGPGWGYRRKARLGVEFVAKKNRVLIGFREKQARLITDSEQCEVLTPAIGQHLAAFAALLGDFSNRDKIPQLEISAADNANAVVIRHLAPFIAVDLAALETFARQYDWRIYLQPQGIDSVKLFSSPPAMKTSITSCLAMISAWNFSHSSSFRLMPRSIGRWLTARWNCWIVSLKTGFWTFSVASVIFLCPWPDWEPLLWA